MPFPDTGIDSPTSGTEPESQQQDEPGGFEGLLLREEEEEALRDAGEVGEEHDLPDDAEDDLGIEEGGEEEEAPAEGYDDEESEQAPGELHTVTVDGEELQVPYDELVAGYSRQADYTRKTQRLAEAFREMEGRQQALSQERAQYAALLNRLHQTWQRQLQGDEPDWERLKEEDPVGYSIRREEWRERKERIAAAEEELQRVHQQQQAEAQRAQAVRLAEAQRELLRAIPEWQDADQRQEEQRQLAEFAMTQYGFSREELREVEDHRAILLLRDAYRGRQAKAKADKIRRTEPGSKAPTARPGSASSRGRSGKHQKGYEQARERLRKSGSDRDAARAMEHLLAREEQRK